jgi:hypothetical protein
MMSTWRVLGILAPLAACGGCSTSEGQEVTQISFDRIQVEVGVRTTAILAWDIDRDGHLDLVVSGGGRVVALHGRGDGHFDVASSVDAGDNPVDLAAAGGGFARRSHSQFDVGVSPHPHAVRLYDIDGDGHADLLVDDRTPESIRVFAGVGDGTFANARLIGVGCVCPERDAATGVRSIFGCRRGLGRELPGRGVSHSDRRRIAGAASPRSRRLSLRLRDG